MITGGLRVAEVFAKALMLGADEVAIANSAIQAIGCLGMRACNTNNCPVGIARACGHDDFAKFEHEDLSTLNLDMHKLTGIKYAGVKPI